MRVVKFNLGQIFKVSFTIINKFILVYLKDMTFITMPNVANSQITEAREVFQTLLEMSRLLCTGLDPETLTICVRLCEAGVNPEALATIVRELRKEVGNNGDSVTDETNQNC